MGLTSLCLEVWQRWNEDLLQEQRTAVHLDGARQQTPEVVDVPDQEGTEQKDVMGLLIDFLFCIVNLCKVSMASRKALNE